MIKIRAIEIVRKSDQTRREAEIAAVRLCLTSLGINEIPEHNDHGAPYLAGNPDVRISITHSKDWAAVAMGETKDGLFGIDIETIKRPQLEKVAARVLSAMEIKIAESLKHGLTKAWTAKEAVYKAVLDYKTDFRKDICLCAPDFSMAEYKPTHRTLSLKYIEVGTTDLFCLASQCNNFEFITL